MPCPPLAPGKLRIYSMRFCPFCHRSLLVLHAKNIEHEVVNINLKDKPEWHFKLNPAGKVPILQQDDKLVCESLIVAEYLDDAYGSAKLLPNDPYQKARQKMFIEVGSAALMPVLKIHYNKDNRVELWKEFRDKVRAYEEELATRKTPYLSGDKPGFADYMVWPFFPRVEAFSTIFPELKAPTAEEFPLLHKWIEAMKKDNAVKATTNQEHLVQHTRSVLDNNVDYDVGL
uniref:Putative glutathione s-transferase n=1 Tax=Amblyomma aureolatum TaxID=187763 RepID=A0A1E1XCP1_9ACAR